MIEFIFLFGQAIVVGLAGYLIVEAISKHWGLGLPSIALILLTCYWFAYEASLGAWGGVAAFISLIPSSLAVFISGLMIALVLKGWRKLFALFFILGLPISFFLAMEYGKTYSPEDVTERNGEIIVKALQSYRRDRGIYPSSLIELVPTYLESIPEALTTQHSGWLYTTQESQFTLGYWRWPEKMGASVCLYRSGNTTWDCELNKWGPFHQVPTPPHR